MNWEKSEKRKERDVIFFVSDRGSWSNCQSEKVTLLLCDGASNVAVARCELWVVSCDCEWASEWVSKSVDSLGLRLKRLQIRWLFLPFAGSLCAFVFHSIPSQRLPLKLPLFLTNKIRKGTFFSLTFTWRDSRCDWREKSEQWALQTGDWRV